LERALELDEKHRETTKITVLKKLVGK